MKFLLSLIVGCGFSTIVAYGQDSAKLSAKPNPAQKIMLVDVSCGMCQFGMGGDDCKLAVRIKHKTYYVAGAGIDDFGDAHADDGFCNAIRKAKVQGNIKGNLFQVTWLQPIKAKLPESKRKKSGAK